MGAGGILEGEGLWGGSHGWGGGDSHLCGGGGRVQQQEDEGQHPRPHGCRGVGDGDTGRGGSLYVHATG